jgi:TRAP-type uncharacterized transport system substrate-binding protein
MEPLPRGAQFIRAKMLWEIALGFAGDPAIPYTGNRDVAIYIGNGSGEHFTPSLRMSPGSPILSHAVVRGELDAAFVNPSALLTQAYRGTGLYKEPLPVRVIASYPSWDRFVIMVHPRLGVTSLAEINEKRPALRISVREDPTHSTLVLLEQLLPMYGFTLDEMVSWGGSLQLNGPPNDDRRQTGIRDGSIDIIFDEGIPSWLPLALEHGLKPLELEDGIMSQMQAIGWRSVTLPKDRYPLLERDIQCIDYSGWPLYTRASLPDEDAYRICAAIGARAGEISWEAGAYTGIGQLGQDTDATPLDVPLHPGAERWFREQGYIA